MCWGGGLPRDCVVLPVRLKDRLVSVIYMDGGNRGLGGIDLEQMHRLTAATGDRFRALHPPQETRLRSVLTKVWLG